MNHNFLNVRMVLACLFVFLIGTEGKAQQANVSSLNLTIEELFSRVVENNPSLKVTKQQISIAEQNTLVAKNGYLPSASASISGFYLGDVNVYSPDFNTHFKQEMPHFGNSLALEFSQLIWKGGQVRKSVQLASLQEEIAALQHLSNEQNVKLLTLGYYLDFVKLKNQVNVYDQNIQLAEKRLANIRSMFEQEMITRNDVLRTELQVSNLKLAKQIIQNNLAILNKQLNVALGLSGNTEIVPVGLPEKTVEAIDLGNLYADSKTFNPSILLTRQSVLVYETSEKLVRKNWYPALAAFGGNNLMRPLTTASPAMDMFYNTWNVGLSLSYDIGTLWKNNRQVNLRHLEAENARIKSQEVSALTEVAINAAYVKYNEAISQNKVYEQNKGLADENYRIMEKKYENQLALIIDLIDASNSKLDAELQFENSEINILFAHYKMLKEVGKF